MKNLLVERGYTDLGTLGHLHILDECGKIEWTCATAEQPWRNNTPFISCIPEGTYTLKMRESAVVKRTSKNEFERGWEITGVKGRSLIMLHVGNYADDVEGCMAVGKAQAVMPAGWGVSTSLVTFRDMMKRLAEQDEWQMTIVTRPAGRL